MKLALRLIATLLVVAMAVGQARAENRLDIRLDNAVLTWQEITTAAGGSLPERALTDAAGVVIVPQLLKAGFGIAGSYGRGVLVYRNTAGRWQPPVFITASGGSIGWQAGVQALDVVLIFRTREALAALLQRGLTLGADAAVTAGPFGRRAGAASDFASDSAVLSYAISEGLFAGVALDGMLVRVESRNTQQFYRDAGFAPPMSTALTLDALPASARRVVARFEAEIPITPVEPAEPEDTEELVTFGLGENPVDEARE